MELNFPLQLESRLTVVPFFENGAIAVTKKREFAVRVNQLIDFFLKFFTINWNYLIDANRHVSKDSNTVCPHPLRDVISTGRKRSEGVLGAR